MAFEHAPAAVHATLALRPDQCRACLDASPWVCQEPAVQGLSWCPEHRAAYLRPPEPPRSRRSRIWRPRS